MEDKEAIEILTKMLTEHEFSPKEKQAVLTAIGILSWSKLGKSRIEQIAKKQKAKKEWSLGK
jgi:hypothetical protein